MFFLNFNILLNCLCTNFSSFFPQRCTGTHLYTNPLTQWCCVVCTFEACAVWSIPLPDQTGQLQIKSRNCCHSRLWKGKQDFYFIHESYGVCVNQTSVNQHFNICASTQAYFKCVKLLLGSVSTSCHNYTVLWKVFILISFFSCLSHLIVYDKDIWANTKYSL